MSRFDATLNSMEETRFIATHQMLAQTYAKQFHFSFDEVISLLIIYYKIQKFEVYDPKGITRDNFMNLCHCCLEMTNMDALTRIVACLDEKSRDLYISKEFFIKSLSLLLRGTFDERLEFCFKVYDQAQTGILAKENVFKICRGTLKSNVGESDAEEMVKDMVELIMKKMDIDRDGKISYSDYKNSVIRQPLLMEFLGTCLPARHTTHKFLSTFTDNTKIRFFKLKGRSIM